VDQYLNAAIDNITRYGDTDVFPLPIENHLLYDKRTEIIALLRQINGDVDEWINKYPPVFENMLAPVGYTGFRWATQIDPVWNAYFLSLVMAIGDKIEAKRVSRDKKAVFSYRFAWDSTEKTVFDRSSGWREFHETSIERAKQSKCVLTCDISDFYPRIYHHRLDNAMRNATGGAQECSKIMKLLTAFSNNVSYGLPVGGPAARLLSELLLNRLDRLLITEGIEFCRFADDYNIFASSEESAYQRLLFFSESLLENEGLLLQKAKTRVMSAEEFLANSEFSKDTDSDNDEENNVREFLRFRLHFDPYSQTAHDDYEALKHELNRFDIMGMLAREIRKSRVHQALARKLVSALKHLDPVNRNAAISTLIENLSTLYPVVPAILLLIRNSINDIDEPTKQKVFTVVRKLLRSQSHILFVPSHLAYAVRLLAFDASDESEAILSHIYYNSTSSSIRRDVIYVMARRRADFWISDVRKNFFTLTEWERRALIVSSYILGDEGKHWRDSVKDGLPDVQSLVRNWASGKNSGSTWEIPV
jgi:hypothetical protein